MHFCQDELMAIAAALPFIPWICMKCRALYNRIIGHKCDHHGK